MSAETRVKVAHDVLAALAADEFTVGTGMYVSAIASNCQVCALGAVFYAMAGREATEKIGKRPYAGDMKGDMLARLVPTFTEQQVDLIEAAFERTAMMADSYASDDPDYNYTSPEVTRAMNFGHRYDDPADRLAAIMRNIISNNGEFRP